MVNCLVWHQNLMLELICSIFDNKSCERLVRISANVTGHFGNVTDLAG